MLYVVMDSIIYYRELNNTIEIVLKYMIEVKLKDKKDKGKREIRTIREGEGESEFH